MRKIPDTQVMKTNLGGNPRIEQARPNPIKEQKVSPKQRAFIEEYVAHRDATKAAIVAGYKAKTASSMGHQLLDGKRYPLVAQEIRTRLDIIDKKAMLDADGVLRYVHTAMLYRPLEWFRPSKDGGWMIDEEQMMNLPPEIGCLIEEIESKTVVTRKDDDGTETSTTYLKVKLVSKTAMTALAAKHQLTTKHDVTVHNDLDWDMIIEKAAERRLNNPIVARLAQVSREALMAPKPSQDIVDATLNNAVNMAPNGLKEMP